MKKEELKIMKMLKNMKEIMEKLLAMMKWRLDVVGDFDQNVK